MRIALGDRRRSIGDGEPVFVVAEIGLNHNGDPGLAERLVRTAAASGADAVKFQKRDARALLTRAQYDAPYLGSHSYGATYGEHREALELSATQLGELKALAESLGIVFFTSAWDLPSVEVCEEMDVPLYKVASADVTNTPLLERLAATGKPILLSTGMSTEDEVAAAVKTVRAHHDRLVLLQCVSTYPAEFDEINLAALPWLRERFGCLVGYSGHERGIAVSAVAVGLGACVVERHVTIDRTLKGPDHAASLEPPGLMKLVRDVRAVQRAMGTTGLGLVEREHAVRTKLAKSLVASRSLEVGKVIEAGDLVAKSPGDGVSPASLASVVGRVLTRAMDADDPLRPEDLGPA